MNRPAFLFALLGSIMTILFFYIVNVLTSSHDIWFIYPALAVLWWPLSLYCHSNRRYKEFSIAGSLLIIVGLAAANTLTSPGHPWFLYAFFPVLWWPITLYAGRKAGTLAYALIASSCTILYYAALNILISPGHPWAIYPAFAVLWWPLALHFAGRKRYFEFSLAGSALTTAFFILVNLVTTPQIIWAVYPIFAVLWWPLSMYYFSAAKNHSPKMSWKTLLK